MFYWLMLIVETEFLIEAKVGLLQTRMFKLMIFE
jgi:hypothetical protein